MMYQGLPVLFSTLLTVLGMGIIILLLLYYLRPSLLLSTYRRLHLFSTGHRVKYVTLADSYKLCYCERGQPSSSPKEPTLVLLHGYSGSKSTWTGTINKLPKHLHTIAIDLPGHGDSSCDLKTDCDIHGMARRLRQFIQAVDLTPQWLHLVGSSMGGTVAGCYAAAHPERVSLLTLICPVVRSPEKSPMVKEAEETETCCFIDPSYEGCCQCLKLGLNLDVLPYPEQLVKGLAAQRRSHFKYWVPMFLSMSKDIWQGPRDVCLGEACKDIRAPTQLIWGRHDQISDISGMEVLQTDLPQCKQVHIMEDKGHAIPYGVGSRIATLIMEFQTSQNGITLNHNTTGDALSCHRFKKTL